MRAVVLPVGALVVEIGAQEVVDALLAMPHLRVGRPGRVVPLVMLARPRQRRERLVDRRAGRHGAAACRRWRTAVRAARRTARSSAPASGTRRAAPARTRPRPRRRNRARPPPRPRDSRARRRGPARRARSSAAGTAADRRRNWRSTRSSGHSRANPARRRETRPRPAPASPCARNRRSPETRAAARRAAGPGRLEPGFEHMHVEAVDVAHKAGADAGRQNGGVERGHLSGSRKCAEAGGPMLHNRRWDGIPAVFASLARFILAPGAAFC